MKDRSMQEPTFLILTALAAGPQHGYGIITDVLEISDERVRLRAGTLYAALDRLQGEGLIETDREEVVDGRARRYYRLTSGGTARLSVETERMRRNVETAASRLLGRPGLALGVRSPVLRLGTPDGSAT
jgi:DNA-binding PadR family transcriptional regulator